MRGTCTASLANLWSPCDAIKANRFDRMPELTRMIEATQKDLRSHPDLGLSCLNSDNFLFYPSFVSTVFMWMPFKNCSTSKKHVGMRELCKTRNTPETLVCVEKVPNVAELKAFPSS